MRDENLFEKNKMRYMLLVACALIISVVFIGRLANLQIVNGESYREQTVQRIYRTQPVTAPRGGIYDRNGRALVVNRTGFTVRLSGFLSGSEELNGVILELLSLLEEESPAFTDPLPITLPPYEFIGEERETLLETLRLEQTASAPEVMEKLVERYDLEGMSETQQRVVAGVRYEMERQDFSTYNYFTFAEDISIESVTEVRERQETLFGVEISVEASREYTTTFAAHILGRVGPIYKGETEQYLDNGYMLSDIVGKDGIEYTMEEYLRGISGSRVVEQNKYGTVLDVISEEEARSGNSVVLTIDLNLQATAERALKETIESIAARGRSTGEGRGYDATSGAVVAIDVNTGEVLALASHPTYDLSTYGEDFADLLQNPDNPLFNRAISGVYEPGSTYKMVTSLAGLKEGVITPETRIRCDGIYDFYAPQLFRCWVFTDYGVTHGSQDLTAALQNSCNVYYYEVGRLVGIEALNYWTTAVGLGQKTGIELTGEASGNIAGPESREQEARRWYAGDTVQAAIGQSENLFTPIQIANYIATIANGGTHYQPTLIKEINNYHNTEIVEEREPVVLGTLDIPKSDLDAILAGMRSAAEVGTASGVFANYPVNVAGKTGTAQVPQGTANGVFVCFAPYEAPEIAIAVVIEHGGSGSASSPVAKEILDTYFASRAEGGEIVDGEMMLIE